MYKSEKKNRSTEKKRREEVENYVALQLPHESPQQSHNGGKCLKKLKSKYFYRKKNPS